jgi:hypothetical protein
MTETEKRKLKNEIYLKNRILVEGIAFETDIFKHLALGSETLEQVNVLSSLDKHTHPETEFPAFPKSQPTLLTANFQNRSITERR